MKITEIITATLFATALMFPLAGCEEDDPLEEAGEEIEEGIEDADDAIEDAGDEDADDDS